MWRISLPEWLFQILAALIPLGGIFLGYYYYYQQPARIESLRQKRCWQASPLLVLGLGIRCFVRSDARSSHLFSFQINKSDITDKLYTGIAAATGEMYKLLSETQSGSLRWYIMGLVVGAISGSAVFR